MSLTRAVPPAVPSEAQSSRPWRPAAATKNRGAPAAARGDGPLSYSDVTATSATIDVPAAVPSERHSWRPCTPSSAVKYVVEPMTAPTDGLLGGVGTSAHGISA